MSWKLIRIAFCAVMLAGCVGEDTDDTTDTFDDMCFEDNNEYETSGCVCEDNDDCTCQVFTGANFLEESQTSQCDEDGRCIECFYL